MRQTVERGIYPGVLGASLIATVLSMRAGVAPEVASGIAILVTGLSLGLLELVIPHTRAWRPVRQSFGVDLLHTLITVYAVAPAVRVTVLVALASAGSAWVHAHGVAFWPAEWPLLLQLGLAVAIADLGAYSAHRFMHATRIGWRLHAVHHSPQKLNFLASARSHPFNVVLTLSCETGPLVLLGIGPEAFALWTVVKAANGLLQHSNLEMRPGLLSSVLATSEVHRWHHSVDLAESNTNFGNTTVIWDRLFGSYFLPHDRRPGITVGIEDARIPERYFAHLATPFVLQRYERAAN